MKTVRTFFWHDRVKRRWKVYRDRYYHGRPWNDFIFGNSGDIFTRDALAHFYHDAAAKNVANGPRILCVGSIAHRLEQGDVLCGIGCKTAEIPRVEAQSVHVHALRGPISYDVFKAAGYDVSQVRFLADPGLLIGKMVPARKPIRGRVVFIPHYRDRKLVWNRMPKDIRAVDIDNLPSRLAREIQKAECVYSSSLHGLIFAHALGRPCVFVRPMTEEPLLKYEDYFLSVGLKMPVPLESIANVDLASAPTSPAVLSIDPSQISFPSEMLLSARGIIQ